MVYCVHSLELQYSFNVKKIEKISLFCFHWAKGVQAIDVVVVVVLLFHVHGKHLRSCRDGQLT